MKVKDFGEFAIIVRDNGTIMIVQDGGTAEFGIDHLNEINDMIYCKSTSNENDLLINKIAELEDKLEYKQSVIDSFKSDYNHLKEKYDSSTNECLGTIEELSTKVSNYETEIDNLNRKISKLSAEYTNAYADISTEYTKDRDEYENTIKDLKDKLSKYENSEPIEHRYFVEKDNILREIPNSKNRAFVCHSINVIPGYDITNGVVKALNEGKLKEKVLLDIVYHK